jgi:hypothetical protein
MNQLVNSSLSPLWRATAASDPLSVEQEANQLTQHKKKKRKTTNTHTSKVKIKQSPTHHRC